MSFIVLGTNHKYSPIELRESISFSKKRLRNALSLLKERGVLKGGVILSTCNRIEMYASVEDAGFGIIEIESFIPQYHYIYKGREAAKHLFSVACGLDSLILGETQILGQVRFALLEAERAGFVDNFLREIFHSAEATAERIHRVTKISEGKVSIGSIAIDFIKGKLGILSDRTILLIGVGKVTELVLKYLKKEGPKVVFISNRTFEKARNLAAQIGAEAVRFGELGRLLKEADVVITATASPHFVIKKENLEKAINHKLIILDLAIPRDVDPEVQHIRGIELFGLEDLSSIIQKNVEKKKIEARKVRELINVEVENKWREITELEPEPALLP